MRSDEFSLFAAELKQLCASLGKSYTDPLAQAYWRALRDVPLDEVQRHVERILLSAGKDTKFPRPTELRSTKSTAIIQDEDAMQDGIQRCIRNLEELRREDPAKWEVEVRLRKLDRLIAITPLDAPEYEQIRCRWLQARGLHVGDEEWKRAEANAWDPTRHR